MALAIKAQQRYLERLFARVESIRDDMIAFGPARPDCGGEGKRERNAGDIRQLEREGKQWLGLAFEALHTSDYLKRYTWMAKMSIHV